MYAILMKDNGSLTCTTPNVVLYQTESFMDNIHFFIPKQYKDVTLTDFVVTLKYVNPANIAKLEILQLYNDNYKENYLEYTLPVTTELTSMAGSTKLYLSFSKIDSETQTKYIGHTSELAITVRAVNNYFTDESSLQSIDDKLLQLQEIANQLDKAKADNIVRNGNEVYLTSNDEEIGDRINISESTSVGEYDLVEF